MSMLHIQRKFHIIIQETLGLISLIVDEKIITRESGAALVEVVGIL